MKNPSRRDRGLIKEGQWVCHSDEKISNEKCPCCGFYLIEGFIWNPDLFRTKENPRQSFCRNPDCKGWFCIYCDEWHSYRTSCSTVKVRNLRSETMYPESYEEWIKEGKPMGEKKSENI